MTCRFIFLFYRKILYNERMRITKIEKKKRFYLLELDSQENLYITEDTIVRFMLSRGKEISEKELVAIRDFAQFSYGKNLALYFLSFKQRTKKEVTDYLRKYEVDEVKSARILQVLEEEKWIDDRQYVESYLRQNVLSGDKGPALIYQKLVTKGISKNMIETELAGFDFSDLAKRVAEKLVRRYQDRLPFRALQNKLIQGLMNKGFSYELAKSTVGMLAISSDEEMEDELIAKELDKQYRKYSRKYDGYELEQRLIQVLARKGYDFDRIRTVLRDYL